MISVSILDYFTNDVIRKYMYILSLNVNYAVIMYDSIGTHKYALARLKIGLMLCYVC